MDYRVAAFTDTYLPTVNGVAYTVRRWRERWARRGRRMDVVYPGSDGYDPGPGEHPVRSLPFPWYEGYRLGVPRIPRAVGDAGVDVVHAHTPFALGLAGFRLARRADVPLVASYHTPSGEYAPYLSASPRFARQVGRLATRYERWFYDRADVVLVPSIATRRHVREIVGVSGPVRIVSNGVDVERFRPVDGSRFRARHDLSGPLVGYTGRHGYEKRLVDLLEAVDGTDVTLALGGDGPARAALERRARRIDADVRFLGFLDRENLPAFYTALDVLAFPSPVETEGLVALEAIACGTPVVAADRGGLSETVADGETGYHYPPGDVEALRRRIEAALEDRSRLERGCLERRADLDVAASIDRLEAIYGALP